MDFRPAENGLMAAKKQRLFFVGPYEFVCRMREGITGTALHYEPVLECKGKIP